MQRDIKLINGNLLTTYIEPFMSRKNRARGRTIGKVMERGGGGVGLGNFLAAEIFFVIKLLV